MLQSSSATNNATTVADNSSSLATSSTSTPIELIDGKYYPSGTHHNTETEIPSEFKCIKEGTATVIYSKDTEAFYNKVQVFNRDTSTLVIKMFNEIRKDEKLNPPQKKRQHKKQQQEKDSQPQQQDNTTPSSNTPSDNVEQNNNKMDTSDDKKTYEGIRILEALSATGLRSIRYWHEIPNVKQIIANDLLPEAVEVIKRNVEFNEISDKSIIANQADAIVYMASNTDKAFDVVDLDPYGTAAPFIDGAIQSVDGNGGLLCVTCTDMAVLCGQQPGTCFAKYGSYPQKLKSCHEQGLRMLISSIQTCASKYKRYVVPVLSLSIDFYVRIFLRVYTSPEKVKTIYKQFGNVFVCSGCESFYHENLGGGSSASRKDYIHEHSVPKDNCPECGWRLKLSGPMWLGPIHDADFISKCLDHVQKNTQLFTTHKRIIGLLTAAKNELHDIPLFYYLDHVASVLKCNNIPMNVARSAILNAGYRVSGTHVKPNAIKTDAPMSFIYDMMKEWIKTHPVKQQAQQAQSATTTTQSTESTESTPVVTEKKSTPGQVILSKPQKHQVSLEINQKALISSKHTGIPTYLPNPEENWGPGRRKTIHQSVNANVDDAEKNVAETSEESLSPQTKKQKHE